MPSAHCSRSLRTAKLPAMWATVSTSDGVPRAATSSARKLLPLLVLAVVLLPGVSAGSPPDPGHCVGEACGENTRIEIPACSIRPGDLEATAPPKPLKAKKTKRVDPAEAVVTADDEADEEADEESGDATDEPEPDTDTGSEIETETDESEELELVEQALRNRALTMDLELQDVQARRRITEPLHAGVRAARLLRTCNSPRLPRIQKTTLSLPSLPFTPTMQSNFSLER